MTTGALPKTVEVRTLAAREVTISGSLPVDRLPRLSGLIVSASRPFDVVARCFRDEEGRYVLELHVNGAVEVACQRCLTPVSVPVDALSCLAVVWTDEQAAQLPNRYEPLVAEAEIDLWQLVEEELFLFLPSYSYHEDTECGRQVGLAVQDDGLLVGREIDGPEKQNPFDILASLKSDDQGLNTK